MVQQTTNLHLICRQHLVASFATCSVMYTPLHYIVFPDTLDIKALCSVSSMVKYIKLTISVTLERVLACWGWRLAAADKAYFCGLWIASILHSDSPLCIVWDMLVAGWEWWSAMNSFVHWGGKGVGWSVWPTFHFCFFIMSQELKKRVLIEQAKGTTETFLPGACLPMMFFWCVWCNS